MCLVRHAGWNYKGIAGLCIDLNSTILFGATLSALMEVRVRISDPKPNGRRPSQDDHALMDP